MLRMDQVHVIRHKVWVEGRSERQVAREMGVSRNTVRKYLEVSEPVRQEEKPRARPVLEQVRGRVEALLAEWQKRTTRKQRITGSRLLRQLREEGYEVGRTTVYEYVAEWRRQRAEVYVPLVHRPGEEAQVDFFDVTVCVDGVFRKAWLFVLRLMYSGRDFAWIYEHCDQVSFLDGHVRAFEHLGAVPQRAIYDNLRAAVRKVVLPQRELTARFQALVSHYLFEPCFARPGEGHDKGGVEGRGRGIRLQELTPIPEGTSLGEISSALVARLDQTMEARRDEQGRSVAQRFAEELPRMLAGPEPFEARRSQPVSVSRSARVRIEGAWYSVPSGWAGLTAMAYVGPEDVRIVCRGQEELHPRQLFGGKSIRYRHYLPELARKPQAVRQVAAELIGELGEPFGTLWRLLVDSHGPREAGRAFARILGAITHHGEEPVAQAVRQALAADRLDQIVLIAEPKPALASIPVPAALCGYVIESARVADFDALLWEDGDE
jgi:transposase